MIGALLRHQLRKHRIVLVLMPLGLVVFHWFFTRIAPSPSETERFTALLSFLPPQAFKMLGMQDAVSVTTRGVLAFGYVHPFTVLLLSLWTVRVAASDLAGEIGAGTMDLLASRPVGRVAMALAVAGTVAAGIVLGAASAWAGTALGLATRDLGDVRAAEYLPVAAGLALLFAAWGGVALAVSAWHRRGGGSIGLLAGVMAAAFALDYIGRVYEPLRPLRPLSPFRYFAPNQDLYMGGGDIAILSAIAVAGLVVALLVFRHRDL